MVKKTIVEIFDHLDADSDDDITLSDMLRVMSATVTDAGIRGSFKTIDKAGTGHISKAEWKAHWKVQCQHPEHPNTQDLIKLRKQFGLESLLGEPNQDVSDLYVANARKKKAAAEKKTKDLLALNSSTGWSPGVVSALTNLHKQLQRRSWEDSRRDIVIEELVFPNPFSECSLAGAWLCLPDWLSSFETHYRQDISLDKIQLLVEQLGLTSQFTSAAGDNPLFLTDLNDSVGVGASPRSDIKATVELELTLERINEAQKVKAAAPGEDDGQGSKGEESVRSTQQKSNQTRA